SAGRRGCGVPKKITRKNGECVPARKNCDFRQPQHERPAALMPAVYLTQSWSTGSHGKTSEVIKTYLTAVSSETAGPNCPIDLMNQRRSGTGKVQFESITFKADNPSLGY